MTMFSFGDRYNTAVRLDQIIATKKELNRIIIYLRAIEKPLIISYANQEDCINYYNSVINTIKTM